MRNLLSTAALLVPLTLIACTDNQQPNNPRNADSNFENAPEPKVTAQTHFAAGQLAESQGNWPTALEQYQQALQLEPNHQPALFRLAVGYAKLQQYPQAIETWNRYIKATGGSAIGYSNLGFCQELAGDRKAAEAAYAKGIEKDPTCQPCRVNYGLMLARQGAVDRATVQLQAVLSPAEVQYNLGSVYQQQNRKAEARKAYLQALQLDPRFTAARQRLDQLNEPSSRPTASEHQHPATQQ